MKGFVLLIIDMQKLFLDKESPFYRQIDNELIPNIQKLIDACRIKQIPIVFIRGRDSFPSKEPASGVLSQKWPELRNIKDEKRSKLNEIIDELKPQKGDYIVTKLKYSAFFATELDTILRFGLNAKQLVIVGGAVNNCIRATVHDAVFRDYKIIVLRDCLYRSIRDPDGIIAESELKAISYGYGEVMKLEDFLKLI